MMKLAGTRRARWPLAVAVGAFAFGLSPREAAAQSSAVVDSAGVVIVTSDPLNSDRRCKVGEEPFFAVGDAFGDARYEFYTLRGMARLSDGSVAIVDKRNQDVRIFSATGEFVRSMGGRGDGPGEFRNPWFMWALSGDTLWVGDYRPQRFRVFLPTGNLFGWPRWIPSI